jgi:hypothetical protein
VEPKELSFLIDRKEQAGGMDIDRDLISNREMTTKMNKIKISQFDDTENK